MLAAFLHGTPDASFWLIAYGVVAAIALAGAGAAVVLFGRGGGTGRILAALLAGTVGGFVLAYGLLLASASPLAGLFRNVSAGPLLATFVLLALGGGFIVAATILRVATKG